MLTADWLSVAPPRQRLIVPTLRICRYTQMLEDRHFGMDAEIVRSSGFSRSLIVPTLLPTAIKSAFVVPSLGGKLTAKNWLKPGLQTVSVL